jgi:hypothetical protein
MDTLMLHTDTLATTLENITQQFENDQGLAEIIKFIDCNVHSKDFVRSYQNEIRAHINEWPYSDLFTPSYSGLVHRFQSTSINYVLTAMELFSMLKSGRLSDPFLAYEIAVFSEALRGREGKRSKIGLDNQQEILIAELTEILNDIWTPEMGDMDDKLNSIVQTVLSGHSSAAELPEKFSVYIETCNEDITLNNLESADAKSGGTAKKLLREFCCYSLDKFNKQLHQYRAVYSKLKQKASVIASKRDEKIQTTEQIANRIEMSGGRANRFFQLIQQIDHLNFLNDNIDVKYSFKSWPGLMHWNVFANAIQLTGVTVSLSERGQLLINK